MKIKPFNHIIIHINFIKHTSEVKILDKKGRGEDHERRSPGLPK